MNVYRALADQPPAPAGTNLADLAGLFCNELVNIAPARDQLDMSDEAGVTSPVPATGDSLATFLGNRLSTSFRNLDCHRFGLTSPVGVALDRKGTAVAVAYNTMPQVARSAPVPRRSIGYTALPGRHATRENQGVSIFIAVLVLVIAGLATGIMSLRRRIAGRRAAPADGQLRPENSAAASQRVKPGNITEQLATSQNERGREQRPVPRTAPWLSTDPLFRQSARAESRRGRCAERIPRACAPAPRGVRSAPGRRYW